MFRVSYKLEPVGIVLLHRSFSLGAEPTQACGLVTWGENLVDFQFTMFAWVTFSLSVASPINGLTTVIIRLSQTWRIDVLPHAHTASAACQLPYSAL